VLRHQLMVVRWQVTRPRYGPEDRMVLAIMRRVLTSYLAHYNTARPHRCIDL
jgi:hypothetical protein